MNQNDFEELRMINVDGNLNILGYLPTQIRRLHLENINIDKQCLRKTIINLENHNLTELRLILIPNVANCLDLILSSFRESKLKILDLKDNKIKSYHYLLELLAVSQSLQELDIRGNKISAEQADDFKFVLHLDNTTLLNLCFDTNEDQKDILSQIDYELNLN